LLSFSGWLPVFVLHAQTISDVKIVDPPMLPDKAAQLLESVAAARKQRPQQIPARLVSTPINSPPSVSPVSQTLPLATALPLGSVAPPVPTPVPTPALPPAATSSEAEIDEIASPRMIAWLQELIRDNLPETYEDTRKWGHQKDVWDGVDFHRSGLQIKTKSKHRMVNDGTWTRYQLKLVDPEHHMRVEFHRLEPVEGGKIAFDVSIDMLLDVFGRLSQWVRDVQIVSLSANADAICTMRVRGTVALQMNPLKFPPDIMLRPHVDAAQVDVSYFRVNRISQLGGPMAMHLGNGLKHSLDNKLEEFNSRLTEKINRQLQRYDDRMVFSMQEWLQSKLPLPARP
jgi:hypothetical protein